MIQTLCYLELKISPLPLSTVGIKCFWPSKAALRHGGRKWLFLGRKRDVLLPQQVAPGHCEMAPALPSALAPLPTTRRATCESHRPSAAGPTEGDSVPLSGHPFWVSIREEVYLGEEFDGEQAKPQSGDLPHHGNKRVVPRRTMIRWDCAHRATPTPSHTQPEPRPH